MFWWFSMEMHFVVVERSLAHWGFYLALIITVNERATDTLTIFSCFSHEGSDSAIIYHVRKMTLMIAEPLLKNLCDACGWGWKSITTHDFYAFTVKRKDFLYCANARKTSDWESSWCRCLFNSFKVNPSPLKAFHEWAAHDEDGKWTNYDFSRLCFVREKAEVFQDAMIYHFTHLWITMGTSETKSAFMDSDANGKSAEMIRVNVTSEWCSLKLFFFKRSFTSRRITFNGSEFLGLLVSSQLLSLFGYRSKKGYE